MASSSQVVKKVTKEFQMDHPVGKILDTNYFEVGDVVCARKNYKNGLSMWFTATDYDVEHYSGYQRYFKLKFD